MKTETQGFNIVIEPVQVDNPFKAAGFEFCTVKNKKEHDYADGFLPEADPFDTDRFETRENFNKYLYSRGLSLDGVVYSEVYLFNPLPSDLHSFYYREVEYKGLVGFLYMRKEMATEKYGDLGSGKLYEIVEKLMNQFRCYKKGEVFRVRIPELSVVSPPFYGKDHEESGLQDYVRYEINCYRARVGHIKKLKNMIKSKVSLDKRTVMPA